MIGQTEYKKKAVRLHFLNFHHFYKNKIKPMKCIEPFFSFIPFFFSSIKLTLFGTKTITYELLLEIDWINPLKS